MILAKIVNSFYIKIGKSYLAEQFRQIKRSVAELFRQIKRSVAEHWRFNRKKKHIKGGGRLYGGSAK